MAYKNFIFGIAGSVSYGGAYDSTGSYAATYATSMGASGIPLVYGALSVVTDLVAGISITVTADIANHFANCLSGCYVYLDFTDNVAYTDGHYLVQVVEGTGDWIAVLGVVFDGGAASQVVAATVGGSFPATEAGLEYACTLMAAADKFQLESGDTFTVTAWDFTGATGTALNHIVVEGVDSSGVRLAAGATRPILVSSANNANGVLTIAANMDYLDFYSLDIDGGGDGNTAYCVDDAETTSDYHRFFNCRFHNASSHGVYHQLHDSFFFECEIDNNNPGADAATHGIYEFNGTYNRYVGCVFHDHGGTGASAQFYTLGALGLIENCEFYSSAASHGIIIDDVRNVVVNNTLYGHHGDGIQILAVNCILFNNTVTQLTGKGLCYNFSGNYILQQKYFGYNHAEHADANDEFDGADADFPDAVDGNNIHGDAGFVSVTGGSEDFTPAHGSRLLGAGGPVNIAHDADPDAFTNYPHIGAVTRKEPKTRLIGGI